MEQSGELVLSPEERASPWPRLLLLWLSLLFLLLWLPCSSSSMPSTRLPPRLPTYCCFRLNSSCPRPFTLFTPWLKVFLTREALCDPAHERACVRAHTHTHIYPFTTSLSYLTFPQTLFLSYQNYTYFCFFMSLLSVFPCYQRSSVKAEISLFCLLL